MTDEEALALKTWATEYFQIDEHMGGRQVFVDRNRGPKRRLHADDAYPLYVVYRLATGPKAIISVVAYELDGTHARRAPAGSMRKSIADVKNAVLGDDPDWVRIGVASDRAGSTRGWTRRLGGSARCLSGRPTTGQIDRCRPRNLSNGRPPHP